MKPPHSGPPKCSSYYKSAARRFGGPYLLTHHLPCLSGLVDEMLLSVLATLGAGHDVAVVLLTQIRGCADMIGADFACQYGDGQDMDACQIQESDRAHKMCASTPGCVAIVQSGGRQWSTLKAAFEFDGMSSVQNSCRSLAQNVLFRHRTQPGAECNSEETRRWQIMGCAGHARPSNSTAVAVDPRPTTLNAFQPAVDDWNDFRCISNAQLRKQFPVHIHVSKSCIRPSPTPDTTACTFPRHHAFRLCKTILKCNMLHCERGSDYCQVLKNRLDGATIRPSFGDVDLFVRVGLEDFQTNMTKPASVCASNHYTNIAASFDIASQHFSGALSIDCKRGSSKCSTISADVALLEQSLKRLKQLLITTAQRFHTHSSINEPKDVVSSRSLIVYQPAQFQGGDMVDSVYELASYRAQYKGDIWLTDVQSVYDSFFGTGTAFHKDSRRGFFVEAGAVQGTVFDSNSIFFERFLDWTGLLVEANPYSFAKLMTRRPASYRVETALCDTAGTLRFDLPDRQRTADGCCARVKGDGKYEVRCTPLSALLDSIGVKHIDFWSLECVLKHQIFPTHAPALPYINHTIHVCFVRPTVSKAVR